MTTHTLYTRCGEAKQPNTADGRGWIHTLACWRCGGAGGADKWQHTGWTCWLCNGSGKGSTKTDKLYTREELAVLDARLAKRHEREAAKRQAEADRLEAERAALRDAFKAEHAELLALVAELVEDEAQRPAPRDNGSSSEIAAPNWWKNVQEDVIRRCHLPEKLAALIQERHEQLLAKRAEIARKLAAGHIGEVGKRVKGVKARVVGCKHICTVSQFPRIERFLVKLETEQGHQLTWWTGHGEYAHEDFCELAFTVKEHGEFNGIPQTTIQRPTWKA